MNKVVLMGRLTKDVEVRRTQNNIAYANFTIAVSRRFSKDGQQQSDFINCVAWRQTAEFISKYFAKGSMIGIIGRVETGTYTDRNGIKRTDTKIAVDEAYFTGEKKSNGYATVENQNVPEDVYAAAGFIAAGESDEDLPF